MQIKNKTTKHLIKMEIKIKSKPAEGGRGWGGPEDGSYATNGGGGGGHDAAFAAGAGGGKQSLKLN